MEEAARRVRCCIMFFLLDAARTQQNISKGVRAAKHQQNAAAKGQFPKWRFQGRDVVVTIPTVRPSTQLKQTHSV